MSFSGWKAKLTVERPYYQILVSHKEEETIYLPNILDEPSEDYVSEKSQSQKNCMVYLHNILATTEKKK